jgi:RNA polymerase sigma factor (sigma-70 family)
VSGLADHTDAQLVAGVLAGDREAFAAVYDRYADRLHDFCHAVLRDRDDAADAVQDTFVLVAQRLAQLNDPDRLRPWLYAVARSVALRKVRNRHRVVLDEVEDMADPDPGPDRAAEQVALRELVWSAAAGLSERDRALLDLHVRQGLDGAELGEAMGVGPDHAYVLLTRLRHQVERSLGALLIARQGRRDCTELDALLSGWDGRYSPLLRKRVARHVDSCAVCDDRRRIMVGPFALLAAVPLLPAPTWLRDSVMDEVELAAFHSEQPADGEATVAPAATADTAPKRQRARVVAAAAVVAALLAVAGVVAYLRGGPVPGDPQALEFPASPTLSGTTSSGTASPTTTTTASTTEERVENPDDPETTTTTSRRVVPDPPDPPDPSDPRRDTTPPVIARAVARPAAVVCKDTTTVSATITDDVGVESATLTWREPDGTATMAPRGDVWSGTAGPLTQDGVEWTITAVDAAGNRSSATGAVAVSGCDSVG